MELLKKNISLLNWVEPRFTLQDLLKLQNLGPQLTELQLRQLLLKKESWSYLSQLLTDVERAQEKGHQLLCVLNENYPVALKAMLSCPVPLMFRGQFNLSQFNLSVVGSRKPNSNSLQWLREEFYSGLTELKKQAQPIAVLSGGAYGVDQESHRVSLLSGTPTICFLPSGMNEVYPSNIEPMLDQIEQEGGAVVTPFAPSYPIYKSNFYYRNRILVLLSDLVFVIEARRRSGTMMTASLAAKLGKPVVALPQNPQSSCLGGLDLIREGAPIIADQKDLIFSIVQNSKSQPHKEDFPWSSLL